MHTELLNNWRPKDNFRFDAISDRQAKNHLVGNNFCAAIFVLLFLYFTSRGKNLACEVRGRHQTSRVRKTGKIHLNVIIPAWWATWLILLIIIKYIYADLLNIVFQTTFSIA